VQAWFSKGTQRFELQHASLPLQETNITIARGTAGILHIAFDSWQNAVAAVTSQGAQTHVLAPRCNLMHHLEAWRDHTQGAACAREYLTVWRCHVRNAQMHAYQLEAAGWHRQVFLKRCALTAWLQARPRPASLVTRPHEGSFRDAVYFATFQARYCTPPCRLGCDHPTSA
jgi:hypothetical protein